MIHQNDDESKSSDRILILSYMIKFLFYFRANEFNDNTNRSMAQALDAYSHKSVNRATTDRRIIIGRLRGFDQEVLIEV